MACVRRLALGAALVGLTIALKCADQTTTQTPTDGDSGIAGLLIKRGPGSANTGGRSPAKGDGGLEARHLRAAARADGSAITLYHSVQARSFRVLWTLHELNVTGFKLVTMPFPPRYEAWGYKHVNVLGTIPYFVHGDAKMTESCAIPMYLVERFGPTPLQVRPDEADFGAYLNWIAHADATLTFPQTVFVRFAVMEREKGLSEAGELYAKWFVARLKLVDQALEDGREFLCAGRFTIADVCVAYALSLGAILGLDRTYGPYAPQTAAYLDRMRARPAYVAALEAERASMQAWAQGAQRL